jgi:hypothetical protein
VEFKSTLEKAMEESEARVKEERAKGHEVSPDLLQVFKLIKNSLITLEAARRRSIMVTRFIQPSITDKDLKIASDMQLATASELVLNLLKEGLISINNKEA